MIKMYEQTYAHANVLQSDRFLRVTLNDPLVSFSNKKNPNLGIKEWS
jgi:hypothetical protein